MTNPFVRCFICIQCGKAYPTGSGWMTCPECGPSGTFDIDYDWEGLRKKIVPKTFFSSPHQDISRYAPLLPVAIDEKPLPLPIGWTPLVRVAGLGESHGIPQLWIKDESRQPSASLKDRASVVAVLHARQKGAEKVATASTGNAASSLATVCAVYGMEAVIFVPSNAPRPKLAQLQICGARLFLVEGTYDDAFRLCGEACKTFGWYNRSTGINPYCAEGKKTCAYEIWEQLEGNIPDRVFVSVGDGCILAGLYKGFSDLFQMGWTRRMPRLYGVQAEGSSVIASGYRQGKVLRPVAPTTYADSISVKHPSDYLKAWRAVEKTHGRFVIVSDDEIQSAVRMLARRTGIFGEPSGAASIAGLLKAVQNEILPPDERIVCVMTGSGLKDVEGALKACDPLPEPIPPELSAIPAV